MRTGNGEWWALGNDEELKELVASLSVAQKETDRQLKETDRQLNEFRRTQAEANQELRKQLGGLGNRFGDVAEACYPVADRYPGQAFRR
jgi:hypothetical protein